MIHHLNMIRYITSQSCTHLITVSYTPHITVSYSLLAQLQSLGVANTHPSNAHVLWGALETTLGGPTAAQLGMMGTQCVGMCLCCVRT